MRGATIVFDLDGTLVDTAPDLIAATQHVMACEGLAPVDTARLRARIGFGARAMIIEALNLSGTDLDDAAVDDMLEGFLAHYSANIARFSRPFPGCINVLNEFRSRGARLCVCTNKRQSLTAKLLDALDMTKHFDAIAGRDTFPVCKPDPAHLTGVIEMAGGNIDQALMVGDSSVDVATARAAGISVVTVDFGYPDKPVGKLGGDALIGHYDALRAHTLALLGCD